MNDEADGKELKALQDEIVELKKKIKEAREAVTDTTYVDETEQVGQIGIVKFSVRKKLKGHLSKVSALQWAKDSRRLVSVADDARGFLWDTYTKEKLLSIHLESGWTMCCGISPNCEMMASGGLDEMCTIHRLTSSESNEDDEDEEDDDAGTPVTVLTGHGNYVSGARFLDSNDQLITSSGDSTCALWNIETSKMVQRFEGHSADINSMALSESNRYFVTCSSDFSAKLWDWRVENAVATFEGHEQDVNGADFFPNNDMAFATSSDDGSCRVWDIRSENLLATLFDEYVTCNTTCVAFSKSGRLLIAGYDDFNCAVWDVLLEERVGILPMHDARVSCIGVSGDGIGVATGAWDNKIFIWNAK